MAGFLIRAAILAAGLMVIAALWRAAGPRRHFVVKLRGGEPRVVLGAVTPAFLRLVREVAEFHGLARGRVTGVTRGRWIGLDFSRTFPEPARQQIRNGWGAMGWRPGPRKA